INIEGKNKIAQLMVNIISDDDIVYMGTGSTIEAVSKYLEDKKFKLVTNSLELFNSIKNNNNIESMLIGGNYRPNTGAFVGKFASDVIRNLRFKIAFAGTNGVNENDIFTYNEEEGEVQKIALNNSMEKYIVADSSKMKHQDFLSYYKTENLDAIISDDEISKEDIDMIQSYTDVIYK
ncbi:MAG: DeoR family transcriptional regulator, partial [Anaerococcus sp.]|nr:DeoR family transcriptional regulator [Anaerococcus sp.]